MTARDAKKIIELVDAFALEMKGRMIEAPIMDWNNPNILDSINERLDNVDSKHALIDTAILAMIIWYHTDDDWSELIVKIRRQLG